MATTDYPILNNMTDEKSSAIRAATEQRAKTHAQAEAQALLEESLKQIAVAICTPRVPVFVPAPKTREPVVHFGIVPEDAARLDALIAHAAKKAEQNKLVLATERLWEVAFIAAHGCRPRVGKAPIDSYKGQSVYPLLSRSDKVCGHITLAGGARTGVKVYDSFGAVMVAVGLPMCEGERWSRFTRGFERIARVKPEIFRI